MSYFKKVVAILLLLVVFGSSCAFAASGQHEVTASRLYFRENNSSDSRSIASLSKGTVVTVLSTSGGWAKARWDGKEGYLSTEYLEKITEASIQGSNTTKLSGTAWTNASAVMYKAADTSSEKIFTLDKGEKLSVRGETLNFYYVKAEGESGYVLKSWVSFDEVKQTNSSAKSSTASSNSSAASASGMLSEGCEGEEVKELQKRLSDLGYMSSRYITGYFGSLTYNAVIAFQSVNSLDVDGIVGPATRKKLNSSSAKKPPKVIEMDWYKTNVSSLVYKRGGTAQIIDCATDTVINIRRVGGSNHMDIEPLNAEDTEKLLKLYGGRWSWDRRAVVLVAGGKYIAASINGMPHGSEISTCNNFEGQFCLHTTNSRTHGTDRVDGDHQSCIRRALSYDF